MRPYHSDEELETTGMERAMAWGVAFAVFSGLFLAMYWLIEPTRINNAVEEFYQHDVAAGREEYQNACAACHGVDLKGGSAPHPDPEVDTPWPAPALDNIVARYQDSEIVPDVREHIQLTLDYGRPGTPMQPFSTKSGGSLSANQVDQLIAYILSVQTGEVPEVDAQAFVGRSGDDLFADNCARCHGQQAQGYVGPQLINVFERYGWDGEGDEAGLENARAAVRQAIRDGRYVPGNTTMPAFDQTLTDDAIDAIVEYLESFQTTGGPAFGQLGGDPVIDGEDD
jgi:mono/diheme cytochrome c family protein